VTRVSAKTARSNRQPSNSLPAAHYTQSDRVADSPHNVEQVHPPSQAAEFQRHMRTWPVPTGSFQAAFKEIADRRQVEVGLFLEDRQVT
jgi:hypothetical protein